MMLTFAAGADTGRGYLAVPPSGSGPGVLVLHAWWGLTPIFQELCDRLAAAGFVALAPDLYGGPTAATIAEAEALLQQADGAMMQATALGALEALRVHPAVTSGALGTVGFSMGAGWAFLLATREPAAIAATVVFYGAGEADGPASRSAYLGHYAPGDPWEPDEGVTQLEQALRDAGRDVTFHHYPGASHWFFERDRPEYDAAAAGLAWERTVAFLRDWLSSGA